ncbi:MAG: DUF3095 domain-containing protein [Granulosicoccus sp.]
MAHNFFKDIPEVTRFMGVVDDSNFYPVPDNWIIVVADITSSTAAVAAGKYKDVNMIGGAVICAVQNATGTRDWPFVFGGDGATVLIPPTVLPAVEAALVRTRSLARDDFDLELRIGFVPVSVVRGAGVDILVARHEVAPGNNIAMFGGGGVELADELVKSPATAAEFCVSDYSLPGLPDLTGLSCRWEPLSSQKGTILCLLVKPQAKDFHLRQGVLSEFLSKLAIIIGEEFNQASPVSSESMRLSWPPSGLVAEAKATRADASFIARLAKITFESLFQWVLERFDLSGGGYDAKAYRAELRSNTDFCRFDDVLRMVLDCSSAQVEQIRVILNEMHEQGSIDFGIFETRQALMTCLLFDLDSSEHLHFIDGDDGGFWSASRGLKSHLTSRNQPL